jgi:hypothetical protein
LAFGRQVLAPLDTTIGNSTSVGLGAICAAELRVVAVKARNPTTIVPLMGVIANFVVMCISFDFAEVTLRYTVATATE